MCMVVISDPSKVYGTVYHCMVARQQVYYWCVCNKVLYVSNKAAGLQCLVLAYFFNDTLAQRSLKTGS